MNRNNCWVVIEMDRILVLIPQGSKKSKNVVNEMRILFPEADIQYLNVYVPDYSKKGNVLGAVKEIRRRLFNISYLLNADKIILYANGSAWHNVVIATILTKMGIDFDIYTFERKVKAPTFTINTKDL